MLCIIGQGANCGLVVVKSILKNCKRHICLW